MGTPHQGGNGVQLGRVLANVASLVVPADDRLLKHLERDSEWLQQQLGQYGTISNDFETKYAFEEYATPTALGHSIMVRTSLLLLSLTLSRSRWSQKHRPWCQDTRTPSRSLLTRITPPWSVMNQDKTQDM